MPNVTRKELYDQVWQTPMSRLAARHGVSDVALAKTCKRLQIPRPGRGYWAQVAAGAKPKRPSLPSAAAGVEEAAFLQRVEQPISKPPPRDVPAVPIPKSLKRAEEAVRDLGAALVSATADKFDRLVVPGARRPTFEVTIASHRRALLLLNGLAKALVARGHRIIFRGDGAQSGLAAIAGEEEFGLSVTERLDRREHELTADEQAQVEKGYRYGIAKYDHFSDGRLQLFLHAEFERSWSDTKTRRLETSLGSIVLAVEDALEYRHAAQRAAEERRRQEERQGIEREAEQRRQRELEARAKHQDALRKDLHDMARRWKEAQEVKAFLHAIQQVVAVRDRSELLNAWLSWAIEQANALDPLTSADKIAKRLEPEIGVRRDAIPCST